MFRCLTETSMADLYFHSYPHDYDPYHAILNELYFFDTKKARHNVRALLNRNFGNLRARVEPDGFDAPCGGSGGEPKRFRRRL